MRHLECAREVLQIISRRDMENPQTQIPAVIAENITKYFPLKPQLMRARRDTVRSFMKGIFRKSRQEKFLALDNVSFEVFPGESVGIVGSNGSGKSTLLRILTGISRPTSGRVVINGKHGELFSLNTGFNMDLSGRKNIYLHAAMKGYSSKEIESIIDEIITFSELERFIDEPVKNYSSGMRGRLGFSIVTFLIPEIIFIDEALSTGDTNFVEKCRIRLQNHREEDKTLVIVSHAITTLKDFCDRIIWLEKGKIRLIGDVETGLAAYKDFQMQVQARRSI